MVVHGNGQDFFGMILTNDMLVEISLDYTWFLEIENGLFTRGFRRRFGVSKFAINNGFTDANTGITNENTCRAGNHFLNFPLWLPTKRTEVNLGCLCHLVLFRRFLGNHFVDQPVILRFVGGHVIVPIRILFQLLDRFAAVLRKNFIDGSPPSKDFLGSD